MLSRIKSYFCFPLVCSGNCFFTCVAMEVRFFISARDTPCIKFETHPDAIQEWDESNHMTRHNVKDPPGEIIIRIWEINLDRMMLDQFEFRTGTRFKLA